MYILCCLNFGWERLLMKTKLWLVYVSASLFTFIAENVIFTSSALCCWSTTCIFVFLGLTFCHRSFLCLLVRWWCATALLVSTQDAPKLLNVDISWWFWSKIGVILPHLTVSVIVSMDPYWQIQHFWAIVSMDPYCRTSLPSGHPYTKLSTP